MKKTIAIILSIILCFTFAACGQKPIQQEPQSEAVDINELKIVSGAPGITEILIGLGLGDNIVAIDQYSADIEGTPEGIPAMDLYYPDAETIIGLKPNLVFSSVINSLGGEDPFAIIKESGIEVLEFSATDSFAGIMEDIEKIAEATGTQEKGIELIDNMKKEIEEIRTKAEGLNKDISIYFEISPAPNIYSGGKDTFHNEIMEILGVKNIFGQEQGWISPSEEAIIKANPDIIITNVNYVENAVDEIKSRKGWGDISAIKNNKVFQVATNSTSRPSQNITKGLKEIAEVIYPEEFK